MKIKASDTNAAHRTSKPMSSASIFMIAVIGMALLVSVIVLLRPDSLSTSVYRGNFEDFEEYASSIPKNSTCFFDKSDLMSFSFEENEEDGEDGDGSGAGYYSDGEMTALTFDTTQEELYTVVMPALKKYSVRATFFISPDRIGTDGCLSESMVEQVSQSGCASIQCHAGPSDGESYEECVIRLKSFRKKISSLTGSAVTALSFPEKSVPKEFRRAAKEAGFVCVYSDGKPNLFNKYNPFSKSRTPVP